MSRVAWAACVALAALTVTAPASASEARPTLPELEHEVMCPTCHTTLDVSDAPIADRIRAFIRSRIAAGETKSEIKTRLVAQFGEAVLAAPPRRGFGLLAWLLPLALIAGGACAVAVGICVARRVTREAPEETMPIDPRLERRLDAELARLEP
jgi:cytochrome c-type biogenesis protein CcmH